MGAQSKRSFSSIYLVVLNPVHQRVQAFLLLSVPGAPKLTQSTSTRLNSYSLCGG